MKIKIMLAVPTAKDSKGWRIVANEVVDLDIDKTIEEIMELLVKKLNK